MSASAPDRRVALVVTLVGGLAFVVLAALLVPWHPVPGGTPDAGRPATSVFTAEQIARGRGLRRAGRGSGAGARWRSRWWSPCVLGFSRLGPRLVGRLPRLVVGAGGAGGRGRRADRPAGHAAVRGAAAPPRARLRAQQPVVERVRGGPGAGPRPCRSWRPRSLLVVLVGCARRWRRAWPAVAGGAARRAGAARARSSTRCSSSRSSTTSPRCPTAPLRTEVLELADREGVPVDDVLVADASRRTTTLNAYVSGFGSTRRVVLYDNLVDDVPRDQALSVVAHELAHAKHDDVLHRLAARRGRRGLRGRPAGAGAGRAGRARGRPAMRRPGRGAAGAGAARDRHAAGQPVAERASAARSRPAPTSTRSRPPGTPTRSIAVQRQLALRSLADPTPPALVAVLVRLAPDRADPDRDRPAARGPRLLGRRARQPRRAPRPRP